MVEKQLVEELAGGDMAVMTTKVGLRRRQINISIRCFQGGRSCIKTEPDLRRKHIPGVWNSVPSSEGISDQIRQKILASGHCFTGAGCRAGVQWDRMLSGGIILVRYQGDICMSRNQPKCQHSRIGYQKATMTHIFNICFA